MGVLVFIMPVSNAMVLHGLIQLTSNGYRAWLNRKDINWVIISTIVVGNIIALTAFLWITFCSRENNSLFGTWFTSFYSFHAP